MATLFHFRASTRVVRSLSSNLALTSKDLRSPRSRHHDIQVHPHLLVVDLRQGLHHLRSPLANHSNERRP